MADAPVLRLADQLAPRNAHVRSEVSLALLDPGAYARRFARRIEERDVDASDPELPWGALVDALEAHGRLFPVDHRSFPDAVMHAIDALAPRGGRFAWARAIEGLDEIGTADFLSRAAKRMRREERRSIVALESERETDTFPIVVVPAAGIAKLAALVAEAGHELVDFATWAPPPPAKDRAPSRKGGKNATAPRRRRMYWRSFRRGAVRVDLWVYPRGFDVHAGSAPATHLFARPAEAATALDRFAASLVAEGYEEVSPPPP